MKRFLHILFVLIATILLIELVLHLLEYQEKHAQNFLISIEPESFFKPDSVSGWSLREGRYTMQINQDTSLSTVSVNKHGDRISFLSQTEENKPVIQLYGCSNTFGYSLNDDQVQSHYLQGMLHAYEVQNKGIPAFGLTQMFLHLKRNVELGNTPDIAVFNYANFHDIRTPQHKEWSTLLWKSMTNNENSKFEGYTYPYFVIDNNHLSLEQLPFYELQKSSLERHSAIASLIGDQLAMLHDRNSLETLNRIALLTAQEIIKYCVTHGITPIFAQQTNSTDVRPNYDLINSLKTQNFHTLVYSIDYADSLYNNCPFDCAHPNERAQYIFAKELFVYLDSTKITGR